MKRLVCGLAATIGVCACGGTTAAGTASPGAPALTPFAFVSPAATAPALGEVATAPRLESPSPPARSAQGVLVDLLSDPATYTMTTVSVEGRITGRLQARQRTPITTAAGHAITLPYVTTSLSSLYYLDGDSTVRAQRLDGTAGTPTELDLASGMEAAFAVSPDDTRIAVSVLDFNATPVRVTLYVDAVGGGSRHVIFESTSDYVWPVAWHAGQLVLAHAYGPFEEDIAKVAPGRDNPYSAISYHVVDPSNANRVVLMGSCTVSGPLSPAGSGCIQGGSIDWKGNTATWSTNDWGSISAAAALSPDGEWMAAARPGAEDQMAIWRRADGLVANYVGGPGGLDWAGWLDGETLVIGSYRDLTWKPIVVNVIRGGVVHVIAAHGFVAALLPTPVE